MKRLLLIGAGHAHALVLDAWRHLVANDPLLADVELVLVAPVTHAPYSGMIPGWLAGKYRFDETVVDFTALCKRARAKLICAELAELDPDTSTVWLSDGQRLSYDWISLNVGSTLQPPASQTHMLAMRPLSTLKSRYEDWLAHWRSVADTRPLRLAAVGGGAAGIESLLCIKHRLRSLRPDIPIQAQLLTRGTSILPGFSSQARRLALAALKRAGVTIELGTAWRETIAQSSDLVIWATGAQPHAWQTDESSRGTLQTDRAGFILVDQTLQSLSHSNVFAVGDCAALPTAVPKAGVYAVRMGSTLTSNLRAAILDKPMSPFKRTGAALALLNTADGNAIASWGPLGWQGRWVMRWKDRIDRRFISRLAC